MNRKKLKYYWRCAYLLPKATWLYLKGSGAWKLALPVLALALLILLGATALRHNSKPEDALAAAAQTEQASQPPVLSSPSPSPSPTPTPAPVELTLSFAGDCTLGRDYAYGEYNSLNSMYDQQGADYFLKNVKDIFSADDLTVVNFEGTLTQSQDRASKPWAFKGDAEYANILTAGSVEAVNLANNHTEDYGDGGFRDTVAALDQAELIHFGFDETAVVEIQGVKVGLTGMYTVFSNPDYPAQLEQHIQSLRNQGAQLIIASFHWGMENDTFPDADQIELAHAAIDAGAHLVIGHHPHVLQGIERYHGRYICYSIGNFCFGGNSNPQDYDTMIFQQTFSVSGDTVAPNDNVTVIPCSVSSTTSGNNYQPTPASGSEAQRILDKLRARSDGLGEENAMDLIAT